MWQISIALWKPPWPYGCWFSHNQFLYESKEGKKQSHLKVGWTSINHFYQNQQKYLLQRPWLKHFTSTNVAKYIFGNRIRSFTSLQATAFLPTGKKVKKAFSISLQETQRRVSKTSLKMCKSWMMVQQTSKIQKLYLEQKSHCQLETKNVYQFYQMHY